MIKQDESRKSTHALTQERVKTRSVRIRSSRRGAGVHRRRGEGVDSRHDCTRKAVDRRMEWATQHGWQSGAAHASVWSLVTRSSSVGGTLSAAKLARALPRALAFEDGLDMSVGSKNSGAKIKKIRVGYCSQKLARQ